METRQINETQAEEYLKKMMNFLTLKPKTISKELSSEFNEQKIWAKEFIETYREWMSGGSLTLQQRLSGNPTTSK